MKKTWMLAAAIAAGVGASTAKAALVISELDSDTPGLDTLEFIELFNPTNALESTNGLVLTFFNGTDISPPNGSYFSIDLDGFTVAPGGFFVIGNPNVPNVNVTFAPGAQGALQNGADAVGLFTAAAPFANDTAPTTTNLVDAIVYGTADATDADLLAALSETTQFDEGTGDTSSGGVTTPGVAPTVSLSRIFDGTDPGTRPFVQSNPTPGAINVVPEPTTVGVLALGGTLAAMTRRRKRVGA